MAKESTTNILKALADDTRLNIVRKLAQEGGPVQSCAIVESCSTFLRLSQPAMSHHFSKLVDAGVISEIKVGSEKTYELNSESLRLIGVDANKL